MRKNNENLIRGLLAALIGSRLTVSELKSLADLIVEDRDFRFEFSDMLREISFRIGRSSNVSVELSNYADDKSGEFGGLTDLAYGVIQRKKMSKARLFDLLSKAGFPEKAMKLTSEVPIREVLNSFFHVASPNQIKNFMAFLGVDVSEDPYLDVIGRP